MENIYFVYSYTRLDTNTIFYIGKGKNNRARRMSIHNKYCRHIAQSIGYKLTYIETQLTEYQALTLEIELIARYKQLGYCEANFTLGGEGGTGHRHTEETKRKIGLAGLGRRHPGKGKGIPKPPRTKEHRKKLGLANIGNNYCSKSILCIENGVIYKSSCAAARELKLNQSKISLVAIGNAVILVDCILGM